MRTFGYSGVILKILMQTSLLRSVKLAVSFVIAGLFFAGTASGQTLGDYRSSATGAWSTLGTWQRWDGAAWVAPTIGEGYPGEFSIPTLVTVSNGHAITLDVSPANNIGSLTIAGGNQSSSLTFNATNSLISTGIITINNGTLNGVTKTISVAGGSLACSSITMLNTGNNTRTSSVTVSTGTVTVTGNITMAGSAIRNFVNITGTGALNVGGNITGGTLTTVLGSTVNYNGANQIVRAVPYAGNLTLSGSGIKTMTGVSVIDGNFTLTGTVAVTAATALNIGGTMTLEAGTSFTSGAFTHNLSGNWINNGAIFNMAGGTINFNGNPQSIGGTTSTNFNNVTLSNAGTKTFAIATSMAGNFSINSPAVADLGVITTHTANTLTLNGLNQPAGTYGSSASPATNQNDTYFALTSGFITVASQIPVTYYSNATGNWNSSTTWSTVGFGSPVNAGTFPVSGDIVNIGGGFTVTVTANAACASLTFNAAATSNTVIINAGNTLAVSGAVTIPAASVGFLNLINVGDGNLSAGSVAFTVNAPRHQITISTGTVTVIGNLTGTQASIVFSGAGLLQLGGTGNNSIYTPANGTLTTVVGSTVEYNGANQAIRAHTYLGTLKLSGSGTKTFTNSVAGGTIPGNLTMSGSATAIAVRAFTIGGTVTLDPGATFTAGSFTHLVAGDWINNGANFTNTGGLINLNGSAVQNIGGSSSTTFNNLTLSGTGSKLFSVNTLIDGTLSIPGTSVADLGTSVLNHPVGTLILGGVTQAPGTYGSTASLASNQNDTYFANEGIVTVAGETFYSRQSGNWNDNNTWSFTPTGPAVGAGVFPGVDDIVIMQLANTTVTVTADAFCGTLRFTAIASNRTVTINPGITLSVSNEVTIPRANAGGLNLVNVNGVLNAGKIAFTNGGGGGGIRHQMIISSTGTVNASGDITTNIANAGANITFSGAGTLNAGVGIFTTAPAGGTLTTVLGSTVNYNGAAQTVKPVVYNGNLTFSGSGAKTMTGVTTIGGNFSLSGTAIATPAAALTIGGSVILGTGTTFTPGAFLHNVAGNWTNNGTTFTNTGSTINLNGTAVQNIGGTNSTTFNNLTLSNTGTKTFGLATSIDGSLSIPGPAIADLGPLLNHTASTLILGGIEQDAGTYGSTASSATNQNDTYFANTGIVTVSAVSFYSIANGNWDSNSTWSYTQGGPPVGVGEFPGPDASVNIVDGFNVTVTNPAACASLTFGAQAVSNAVTINSGISLVVSGAITIPRATVNGQTNLLAVGDGILNAGSIRFTNGGGGAGIRHRMTIIAGTVNATGDITTDNTNAGANINLNGAGTINAGVGIFTTAPAGGTLTTAVGSTVNYNGAAQTIKPVNYLGNLILSGSGIKTLQAGTTIIGGNLTLSGTATTTTVVGLSISGSLSIGNGTSLSVAGFPITVGGATFVGGGASGQLLITSASGVKRFNGLVTISNGASWNNLAANSPVFFGGGITNNGSFSSGLGLHTFDNISQVLTGSFAIPNVTITGVTVTNTNSLVVGNALSGTGGLVQAPNAILIIGGTATIATLTASSTGNIVNYNGSINQTVLVPTAGQYANLSFNGTTAAGIATLPASSTLFISENWVNNGTGVSGTFTGFNPNGGTIVFNGNSTVSGASTTSFNNVQLTATSSLTFPGGDVEVAGDIDFVAGSIFNPSNGRVVMNGTAAQSISSNGLQFYSIQVDKAGGDLNIVSSLLLLHLLDIQSVSTVNTNNQLILLSLGNTTDLDASIGPIPAGALINGTVTINRFMDAFGFSANRYISVPVSGATASSVFSDDFQLANGSIRFYNESSAGAISVGYTNQVLTNPLQMGRGYLAWMYDGSSDVTWDAIGSIYQGSVSLPVSYTVTSGGVNNDGWNLVGNPYPSSITWNGDASKWTKSADISPVIYVTDMSSNAYIPFNYTDNSGEGGLIAMGQAFWVKASAASPSLTIHEPAKSSTVVGDFYRTSLSQTSEQLIIGIQNEKFRDRSYLKINENSSDDFDHLYDGYKLKNESLNIYFKDNANRDLVMHTLRTIPSTMEIPLVIEAAEPGNYEISFHNIENFAPASSLFLIDRMEGKAMAVAAGESYPVSITSPLQVISDRFYLSGNAQLSERKLSDLVQVYPNPVKDKLTIRLPSHEKVSVKLMDSQGRELLTERFKGALEIDIQDYPKGMYVLRLFTKDEVVVTKIIKE